MNINRQLTPYNHSAGRYLYPETQSDPQKVDKIVLHTMVGSIDSAQQRFFTSGAGASATYGAALNGEIRQWVSEGDTSWNAGNWPVNTQSIGIEHEDKGNYNDGVRTPELYAASIALCADICRRYGLTADNIHIHKEFTATGCPDGLDYNRIKAGVAAALAGQPTASNPSNVGGPAQPANDQVTVTVDVLEVRQGPGRSFQAGLANTPDGALHNGVTVSVTGAQHGEEVAGNDNWYRSLYGHWFWAGGTNKPTPLGGNVQAVAPAPAENPNKLDYTPASGHVNVTASTGVKVRALPNTESADNQGSGNLSGGASFDITGYTLGEEIMGCKVWLRSIRGNWVWAGATDYNWQAIQNPLAPPAPPTAPVTPAPVQSAPPATETAPAASKAVDIVTPGSGSVIAPPNTKAPYVGPLVSDIQAPVKKTTLADFEQEFDHEWEDFKKSNLTGREKAVAEVAAVEGFLVSALNKLRFKKGSK